MFVNVEFKKSQIMFALYIMPHTLEF